MLGLCRYGCVKQWSALCVALNGGRAPSTATNAVLLQVTGGKQLTKVQFDGVTVRLGLGLGTGDRHRWPRGRNVAHLHSVYQRLRAFLRGYGWHIHPRRPELGGDNFDAQKISAEKMADSAKLLEPDYRKYFGSAPPGHNWPGQQTPQKYEAAFAFLAVMAR